MHHSAPSDLHACSAFAVVMLRDAGAKRSTLGPRDTVEEIMREVTGLHKLQVPGMHGTFVACLPGLHGTYMCGPGSMHVCAWCVCGVRMLHVHCMSAACAQYSCCEQIVCAWRIAYRSAPSGAQSGRTSMLSAPCVVRHSTRARASLSFGLSVLLALRVGDCVTSSMTS